MHFRCCGNPERGGHPRSPPATKGVSGPLKGTVVMRGSALSGVLRPELAGRDDVSVLALGSPLPSPSNQTAVACEVRSPMTVAGPRRICTGFLHRYRLTGDIVASLLRPASAVGRIGKTESSAGIWQGGAMASSTAAPPIVETEDGGREQRWPLPVDEQSLLDLIHL